MSTIFSNSRSKICRCQHLASSSPVSYLPNQIGFPTSRLSMNESNPSWNIQQVIQHFLLRGRWRYRSYIKISSVKNSLSLSVLLSCLFLKPLTNVSLKLMYFLLIPANYLNKVSYPLFYKRFYIFGLDASVYLDIPFQVCLLAKAYLWFYYEYVSCFA